MPGANRIFYLAYGSNLHPRRLTERIGEVELVDVVALEGWRLCFDKRGGDGSAKANLRPVPGGSDVAWVAVYAVSAGQLPLLDRFEGCGGGYETFRFDVSVDGRMQPALAYLTPSHWIAADMLPFDWYRDLVLAGARYHRLPDDYCDRIARQPAVTDPDRARARERVRLLAQIT